MKRIKNEIQCDMIIIGDGVGGTSLAYLVAGFTSMNRILILDKRNGIAEGNSHYSQNSQTLHTGDIETNYNLEKSTEVSFATAITEKYLRVFAPGAFRVDGKMVIAVGKKEVAELRLRFEKIKHLYPKLRLIEREEIRELEPKVMLGRRADVEICALHTEGLTVNFQKLAESLFQEAINTGKDISLRTNKNVHRIYKIPGGYKVVTDRGSFTSKFVAVMAGGYSLKLAKELGYGKDWGIFSIGGNFYFSNKPYLLRMKNYTMQDLDLPMAAVHGDVELEDDSISRFGPTATILLTLDRRDGMKSFGAYLKTGVWTLKGIMSLSKVLFNKKLMFFMLKNMTYSIPLVGTYFFILKARKIVPSLKYGDIRKAQGMGGARHQIYDTKTGKLVMGEAEIYGDKILFNIAPSPGASICIKNAYDYAKWMVEASNGEFTFNQEAWDAIYGVKETKEELVS